MASTVLPNGIIVPEKFSRDWYADLYHNWQELDNLLGGGTPKDGVPDVNNGTLTIQQNGTTVDSFSANSSSDKTVNIQCVDLTNNQTVGGNKEFTGTTTAHDVIPSATDTYNFGSPSYQWNNAYIKSLTINGVACGDILTHNVSEFVDVSSNQTIGGIKTFGSLVSKSNTLERGSLPTATINEDPIFISVDKNNRRTLAFFNYYYPNGDGKVVLYTYNQNTINYDSIGLVFSFGGQSNIKSVYPSITETYNLGTSTNKWKSFNGVEPSDLSLPSDTSITIDTTNFAWGRNFTFTPSVNGYLFINIGNTNGIKSLSLKTGRGEYYFSNQTNILRFTMPVYKGKLFTILANSSAAETVIPSLSLFPCLGNV